MVKQRFGEVSTQGDCLCPPSIKPWALWRLTYGHIQIILGGIELPEGGVVLHRVVANIRIGHSEALPAINCSFQRIYGVSDLTQPTVNLDISALLVSIRAEWELWAVKTHHCETVEIACFAIAETVQMSPECSSALAPRASIGVDVPQS